MRSFLEPVQLGPYPLANRLVIGVKSRMRADSYCPQRDSVEYYRQRSSVGLIVSEPTLVNQPTVPLPHCPGLFSQAQVESWRSVTQAVHQAGGRIFVQLWHSSNLDYLFKTNSELEPSSFKSQKDSLQRADVIQQFRQAAQKAIAADFDGIEIHGALRTLTHDIRNSDDVTAYLRAEGIIPMSVELLVELVDVLTAIWNSDRVGVLLRPEPAFCEYNDADPQATLYSILEAIRYVRTAYLHLSEAQVEDSVWQDPATPFIDICRPIYKGMIIADGQDDLQLGLQLLEREKAELVSFHNLFAEGAGLVNHISSSLS